MDVISGIVVGAIIGYLAGSWGRQRGDQPRSTRQLNDHS